MFNEFDDEIKESCFAFINESCFAFINESKNGCGALIERNCKGCQYYKNTLLENDQKTIELIKKEKEKQANKNE